MKNNRILTKTKRILVIQMANPESQKPYPISPNTNCTSAEYTGYCSTCTFPQEQSLWWVILRSGLSEGNFLALQAIKKSKNKAFKTMNK